jgi:hypothetical protein
VVRVKKEETGKESEIVLTLTPAVTANEIMQILNVNPQWRISGSMLRLREDQLAKGKGKTEVEWVQNLQYEIEALESHKKPRKKK